MADHDPVRNSVVKLEAAGAAGVRLSLALFKIANTLGNAPQIGEVARELSALSCIFTLLRDNLKEHKKLCQLALFKETLSILEKFQDVETKLREIIVNGRELRSVEWFFKSPKAKAYFKKIESIQSAVNLVLHVILLAKEQDSKPSFNNNHAHQRKKSVGNRFREIVESVVQVNRQAIQNAKEEDENWPTEKRRQRNKEEERWCKAPNDTASWLYGLVFSDTLPAPSAPKRERDKIVDKNHENLKGFIGESCQIPQSTCWPKPSEVVKSLLDAWTTVDTSKIEANPVECISAEDRELAEGLTKKIDGYKKHNEKQKGKARVDDDEDSVGIKHRPSKTKDIHCDKPPFATSTSNGLPSARRPTFPGGVQAASFNNPSTARTSGPYAHAPNPLYPDGRPCARRPTVPGGVQATSFNNPSTARTSGPYAHAPNPLYPDGRPFAGMCAQPPFDHVLPPAKSRSKPEPTSPRASPPPPPPPPPPAEHASRLSRVSDLLEKKAIAKECSHGVQTLYTLILQQVEEQITQQRLAETENHERSIRIEECERKVQALCELVLQQLEEQDVRQRLAEAEKQEALAKKAAEDVEKRLSEAVREAREQVEMEAERRAKETKRLADKEIAEVNAAAKAAKKAKELAEAQAAKWTQDKAEAGAREERRRLDEDYKELLKQYKEQYNERMEAALFPGY
ncbi:hypothetical protein K469DRAFT_691952 [Zopfia rhizophila CBS 207.26]|uniref:Fungal N-terminal domain-containing protein n=1 Tax=Zopfia rhizophila CBS 207.26 TaxID=1314779 RepID=A0A6A6DTY9_9PEZI|nr:hypothetical protein K469DRAFT_691952 [Zopfia rhizophila CBS 207.26]